MPNLEKDMILKINRFVALALIALVVAGAMGAISYKVFAQAGVLRNARTAFPAQDCGQHETNDTQEQSVNDADNLEGQCGDQNTPDEQVSGGDEVTETAPIGTPAITADHAQTAALAIHPGTVRAVELDKENGKLVYGIEFEDGADVKVDAMTGEILGTETGQD